MMGKSGVKFNLMRLHAVGDYLRKSAERLPDKIALVFGDTRFTYKELNLNVNRFASALLDIGKKKG